MDLFDLSARLTLDSSGYTSGLDSAEAQTNSFSGGMSGTLASAASTAAGVLGSVVSGVADLTGKLMDGIAATASYGDSVDKASQKLGISAQAYQEWDAVLQHSGTSMSAMSGTFKQLAKASQDATEDQVAAFEALGMSMEQVSSMSAEDLFGAVVNGLQGMEEGTERTALATELLGRGAMSMGALLNTSAEDTQKMIDTVNELGGVMSDKAVKDAAAYTDSLQDMTTAFESLGKSAMGEFLPSVTIMMDGLTGLLQGGDSTKLQNGISSFLAHLNLVVPKVLETGVTIAGTLLQGMVNALPGMIDGLAQFIGQLGQFLADNESEIIDTAFSIVDMLISSLTEYLPLLLPFAITFVSTLALGILEHLPELVQTALELVIALADGILKAIPQLVSVIPQLVTSIVSTLLTLLPVIISAGVQLLSAIVNDMPAIIDAVITVLPELIDGIIMALLDNLPLIIDAGIQLITAIVSDVPTIIMKIAEAIPEIIDGIISALIDAWPTIKQGGIDLFDQLMAGLADIIVNVEIAAGKVIDAIKNTLRSAWDGLKEIGGYLIEGLWQGISDMSDWVVDKISGFGKDILNGLADTFDVHSPSKKTTWFGQMLGEGLVNGLDDSADSAVKSATSMADKVLGTMEGLQTDMSAMELTASPTINATYSERSESEEMNLMREQNELLRALLEKEMNISANDLFTSVQKSARVWQKSTGRLAY